MRTPKPWYRNQNDTWYVCFRGKQVPLAKGKRAKRQADDAFHRLMAEPVASSRHAGSSPDGNGSLPVAVLVDQFLDWVQQNLGCYEWSQSFLQPFVVACGHLTVGELQPIHVANWIATKKTWGPTTRNRIIGLVKQVFNWGIDQGLIRENPIRSLKKPAPKRRERILTAVEREKILAAVGDESFRDFLMALQETGARPGEIRNLTAAQVNLDQGVWVLTKHKTSAKTGRPRIIYLTPNMKELTARLMNRNPEGPIFRNKLGEPWTRNAVRIRFRRLRKRLPELKEVVAYTFRHTFATNALVNGVPIATVAELLGHTTTAMIESHYGHLAKENAYLQQAALQATQSREEKHV